MSENVYQLYEDANFKCPFMVRQVYWKDTAFIVESVGGETEGKPKGRSPYFGNPEVVGVYFDLSTGLVKPDAFDGGGVLSCPGNYKWELLWGSSLEIQPLEALQNFTWPIVAIQKAVL